MMLEQTDLLHCQAYKSVACMTTCSTDVHCTITMRIISSHLIGVCVYYKRKSILYLHDSNNFTFLLQNLFNFSISYISDTSDLGGALKMGRLSSLIPRGLYSLRAKARLGGWGGSSGINFPGIHGISQAPM